MRTCRVYPDARVRWAWVYGRSDSEIRSGGFGARQRRVGQIQIVLKCNVFNPSVGTLVESGAFSPLLGTFRLKTLSVRRLRSAGSPAQPRRARSRVAVAQ